MRTNLCEPLERGRKIRECPKRNQGEFGERCRQQCVDDVSAGTGGCSQLPTTYVKMQPVLAHKALDLGACACVAIVCDGMSGSGNTCTMQLCMLIAHKRHHLYPRTTHTKHYHQTLQSCTIGCSSSISGSGYGRSQMQNMPRKLWLYILSPRFGFSMPPLSLHGVPMRSVGQSHWKSLQCWQGSDIARRIGGRVREGPLENYCGHGKPEFVGLGWASVCTVL